MSTEGDVGYGRASARVRLLGKHILAAARTGLIVLTRSPLPSMISPVSMQRVIKSSKRW